MDNCTPPLPEDVATLLRKQLATCNSLVEACFARASKPLIYCRDEELKMGARLIQSITSLAIALKRLEGQRQDIVVTHAAPSAG